MPGITFTPENIASTNKLEATWYMLEVKSVTENAGKKPHNDGTPSTTWETDFVVAEGPAKGTPIRYWFSDKMMTDLVIFASCFQKPEPGKNFPIEQTVGKKIKGYCFWDMERKANSIKDFQKA